MPQHADRERYSRIRERRMELNARLQAMLPGHVLETGAARLGLLHKKTVFFTREVEPPALLDFCFHCIPFGGKLVFEHYREQHRETLRSDDALLLDAGQASYYSLFVVRQAGPGITLDLHDLLRDRPVVLTDVSFSTTAMPGTILATRVMDCGGFTMTTGAALAFPRESLRELAGWIAKFRKRHKLPGLDNLDIEQQAELQAACVRMALQGEADVEIGYSES